MVMLNCRYACSQHSTSLLLNKLKHVGFGEKSLANTFQTIVIACLMFFASLHASMLYGQVNYLSQTLGRLHLFFRQAQLTNQIYTVNQFIVTGDRKKESKL